MKKFVFLLLVFISFFLVSCQQEVDFVTKEMYKTDVAKNIAIMKQNGLFDSIITARNSVYDEETEKMLEFINNTDKVLDEIQLEDNGAEQIKVIEALFNNGSPEEFADALSYFDEEKANDFTEKINELNLESKNFLDGYNVNYNTVKLSYNTNKTSRALFSDSLTWNSIAVYTGYCVATTAGFCLMSYCGIWLKVAGAIAATAGTLSMSNQLIKWSQCSELFSFISALKSNNGTSLTSIANSQNGSKIITVVTETTITVGVCYCTSAGKALVKSVVSSINSIIDKIIAVLPKGVTISINGVTLKRIGI